MHNQVSKNTEPDFHKENNQNFNWLMTARRSQRRCFLILRWRLFLSLWSRINLALDCSPPNRERELSQTVMRQVSFTLLMKCCCDNNSA